MSVSFRISKYSDLGEQITEHRVEPRVGNTEAYLRLDLSVASQFVPDWQMLMLFLFRHTAMNGVPEDGEIVLRNSFYRSAGIETKDRRRKVLDHIEKQVPNSICKVLRGRGKCAQIQIGPDWPRK